MTQTPTTIIVSAMTIILITIISAVDRMYIWMVWPTVEISMRSSLSSRELELAYESRCTFSSVEAAWSTFNEDKRVIRDTLISRPECTFPIDVIVKMSVSELKSYMSYRRIDQRLNLDYGIDVMVNVMNDDILAPQVMLECRMNNRVDIMAYCISRMTDIDFWPYVWDEVQEYIERGRDIDELIILSSSASVKLLHRMMTTLDSTVTDRINMMIVVNEIVQYLNDEDLQYIIQNYGTVLRQVLPTTFATIEHVETVMQLYNLNLSEVVTSVNNVTSIPTARTLLGDSRELMFSPVAFAEFITDHESPSIEDCEFISSHMIMTTIEVDDVTSSVLGSIKSVNVLHNVRYWMVIVTAILESAIDTGDTEWYRQVHMRYGSYLTSRIDISNLFIQRPYTIVDNLDLLDLYTYVSPMLVTILSDDSFKKLVSQAHNIRDLDYILSMTVEQYRILCKHYAHQDIIAMSVRSGVQYTVYGKNDEQLVMPLDIMNTGYVEDNVTSTLQLLCISLNTDNLLSLGQMLLKRQYIRMYEYLVMHL